MGIRVLDLYSGMGGLSLGFILGLSDVSVSGVDIDRFAVATYNHNLLKLGGRAVIADVLKWEPNEDFDIVIGGVPCQPYSIANTRRRGRDHPLYPTLPRFFDIVLMLRPKVFLMENVKGLVMRQHKPLLDEQLARVMNDYRISYRVLNAAYYGVPQRRERLFVLGIRKDLGIRPSFPRQTHAEREQRALYGTLYRWVTVREAIGDLLMIPPGKIVSEHVMTVKGGWDNPKSDWGSRVLPEDKPSYTITEKHRSGQLVKIPLRHAYRRLTVRECLRLQSFPDWWSFPGFVSTSRKYKLVGEAVPPILAYRIAVHIGGLLGWETRVPPNESEWSLPYFSRAFADFFSTEEVGEG